MFKLKLAILLSEMYPGHNEEVYLKMAEEIFPTIEGIVDDPCFKYDTGIWETNE